VIARQLLKFQLPSPYHKIPSGRGFNVKPYLELLRLVKELGNISKTEVAIFLVQMTNYNKFDTIVSKIKRFRKEISKHKGNRKAFINDVFEREIINIYREDIKADDLRTRESGDTSLAKFLKTKKQNHVDYADAFIRYLRATKFITFEKKTFRMIIAPSRISDVNYLLKTVDREAGLYKTEADFKKYLFNPETLKLLSDDRRYIEWLLKTLSIKYDKKETIESLKNLLERTEEILISRAIRETEDALKNYKEFDDILEVFLKIQKMEVPDPPLYLEWNVWRAMVMMNYANQVKGNFTLDLDGVPLNTALGNMPDIEVEYNGFKIIVEVTMSSGNRQYEMEGEPVARHFGKIQNSSEVPVYCLFIAPKISEGALAHFYNLNQMNTKAYGGKTRIIPMSLGQFVTFITTAKDKGFNNPLTLKNFFESLIEQNFNVEDESKWFQHIHDTVPDWIS
jgi:AlwI restriction endonuclease